MPVGKIFSTHVAQVFFDSRIVPYYLPAYVLTDAGVQITSKLYATLCTMLDVKHSRTTAFLLQTNKQAKRYHRTIAARLRHQVSKNQWNWDKYMQPLTYAYDKQVRKFTNRNLFSLVLLRRPSGPISESQPSSLTTNSYVGIDRRCVRLKVQRTISALQPKANTHMRIRETQYKHHRRKK